MVLLGPSSLDLLQPQGAGSRSRPGQCTGPCRTRRGHARCELSLGPSACCTEPERRRIPAGPCTAIRCLAAQDWAGSVRTERRACWPVGRRRGSTLEPATAATVAAAMAAASAAAEPERRAGGKTSGGAGVLRPTGSTACAPANESLTWAHGGGQ